MGRQLNLLYLYAPGGSTWDDNEIRYSIRSMSTTNEVTSIALVGSEVPSFLKDIHHIKYTPPDTKKFRNLLRQLALAVLDPDLPEDLILMNDDFYMRSTPVWDWTPTHMGPITGKPKNTWQRSVALTADYLRALGQKDPLSYEGHTPMPIQKPLAKDVLARILPWAEKDKVMQFRTAYGNLNRIGGNLHVNAKHKVLSEWSADSPFLSTKPTVGQDIKDYLTATWPTSSRWEL